MSAWSSTRKFIIVTAGALSGLTGYYVVNHTNHLDKIIESRRVYNSWTTNYSPSTFAKWDNNWDQ